MSVSRIFRFARVFRAFFFVLLLPLAFLWAAVSRARRRFYVGAYRCSLPVICVGNIHAGGAGKTPLVLCLADRLRDFNPTILSRGYRRANGSGVAKVDLSCGDGPHKFGDEPWMLANRLGLSVLVGKRRAASARVAEKAGDSKLLILDDGFQHLALSRNVDLVAINTNRRLEDSFCHPLGSLREPLSALSHATAVVFTGQPKNISRATWKAFLTDEFPTVPFFEAVVHPEGLWGAKASHRLKPGSPFAAFSGIADPTDFIQCLTGDFARPAWSAAFRDHHRYDESGVKDLCRRSRNQNLDAVITTEKDWFKAIRFWDPEAPPLLRYRIRYDLPEQFWYFLTSHLESM